MVATFRSSSGLSDLDVELPFIESLITLKAARSRGTNGYSTTDCVRKPTTRRPAESNVAITDSPVPDTESRLKLTLSL